MKKKLVLKALTDPKFRKQLSEDYTKALNSDELAEIKGGQELITDVLDTVNNIAAQSEKVSDILLCIIIDDKHLA